MICNRFTSPPVVIDMLAEEWVGEVTEVSVLVSVIKAWAGVMIITLSNVLVEATTDVSSDIRVEESTDVTVNVLVAMVTALYVSIPAP